MIYEDYFWDFDGTLFDTYPTMVEAFVKVFGDNQIKVDKKEVYEIMRRYSVGEAINWYSKDTKLDKKVLRRHFDEEDAQLLDRVSSFENVEILLEKIVKNGGRNFLLTHRDESSMKILKRDKIDKYFTDYVTAKNKFPRKPNPESLNYLIEKNQVNRKKAVMIGDRNLDIQAGHNAQIAGILFDPDNIVDASSNPELQIANYRALLNKL
ncbi:P-Ser-HPr phosphatase [Ligilactobacillus hayakitensis DSM 18933 = JCM 14209]|uniref:p-Ser-HPr phosphatase n=1 Tax=Ligilactobacillus hayakitensis DSM 18933 = JCM 14209 TaxID=1423755 RepID=A0A0R1WNJ7_9LACO|nr:HAD-IA family hydrolase [Ligilactobacillus hayakitensis]KRM19021.1 P-Ser-HPr phosphatase [Ligilactobacillus hayakitensis DSM 18933 = JCM 14209]